MVDNKAALNAGAAVATGAATLLPLPLLDDWITARSRRQLVESALCAHGRTFGAGELRALYQDGGSWLGLPWRLAKGLLLVPVKKAFRSVFFVLGMRAVALAVGRTLALGHTVDRQLRLGMFRENASAAMRADEARRLRRARSGLRGYRRAAGAAGGQRRPRTAARRRGGDGRGGGFLADLDRRVDQALAGIT